MTATATMTIRVSAETKRKLERLAADTRRSKSFLAAEAVSGGGQRTSTKGKWPQIPSAEASAPARPLHPQRPG